MSSSIETPIETAVTLSGHFTPEKIPTRIICVESPQHAPQVGKGPARKLIDQPDPVDTSLSVLPTPPTSPPQSPSNVTLKDEKLALRNPMDYWALKSRLLPNDGKCGGLTLKKTSCRIPILKENKDQIETQIRAMVALTKSSPELEIELEKFVMLVQCKWHKYGDSRESRIEAWKAEFPEGDDKSSPPEPIERLMKKALGKVSTRCLGVTKEGTRCLKSIGGQKVQNCVKTIDMIVQPAIYMNDAYVDGFLKVLQANMYCHLHVEDRPPEIVASWKLDIFRIRTDMKLIQATKAEASEGRESQLLVSKKGDHNALLTELNNTLDSQIQSPSTTESLRAISLDFTQDPVTFWPQAYDATLLKVMPRSNRSCNDRASRKVISDELKRTLDKRDQKDGYVYLYEVEGNKGFIKIGYTTRSIKERHEEWTFQCNRETKLIYPSQSKPVTVVPNAHRVEALCHAELDYCRTDIYCSGCLKLHIEWFEISTTEAIKVIQKWSKWMTTNPYQPRQLRSGDRWHLKDEEQRKTSDIEQFVQDITAAAGLE